MGRPDAPKESSVGGCRGSARPAFARAKPGQSAKAIHSCRKRTGGY